MISISRRTLVWHVAVFAAACALIVFRCPHTVFHAQYFAEDGHVWFADAYNLGWLKPLFRSQDGYFQTLPRLTAALAMLFPMVAAPLVMNLVGLFVQVLPVNVLLSERCSAWGSLGFRAALAVIYLVLPNASEMLVTITEGQWHLALIACLLVLGSLPKGRGGRIFDMCVFTLSGLTGPFCFLLLPIASLFWWLHRKRLRLMTIAILGTSCLVQASSLLITDSAARSHNAALGATWEWFVRILSGQVYFGTLIGTNLFSLQSGMVFLTSIAAIGTGLLVYACIISRTTEFRLFLLFTVMVFAASLHSPMSGLPNGHPAWQVIASTPGIRYWFFPCLAFGWALVWCLAGPGRTQLSQIVSVLPLCLMFIGARKDWSGLAYQDMHFEQSASYIQSAPRATRITVPENPQGWTITLIKH